MIKALELERYEEYSELSIFNLVESLGVPPKQRIGVISKAQGLQKTSGLSEQLFNVLLGCCYQISEDSFIELAEMMAPRWGNLGLETLEDALDQAVEDTEVFGVAKEFYVMKATNLLNKSL